MSLSDRDLELAGKHFRELKLSTGQIFGIGFTADEFEAFLAKRDQLAIKEKDDAARDALEKAAEICEAIVESIGDDNSYNNTHESCCDHSSMKTASDCANAIRALIK